MATQVAITITADAAQAQRTLQALQQSLNGLSGVKPSADFSGLTSGLGGVTAAIAGVVAAAAGIAVAFKKGLNINAEVESATLGIKSLVAALTTVKDATGKTATGDVQLQIAGAIAEEQVKKLRIAGLETAASFQQLLGAFQQGIGAGSGAGLALDQIREITVGIVQAAGALGLPMDQLNQEVRSLLAGDISNDSTVAKALGITNTQVKAWREAGTLADELNKKLEVFKRLGPETSQTWTSTLANLQEGAALFLGTISQGAFDTLKRSLGGVLNGLFDEGTTNLSRQFSGLADAGSTAFTAIGRELAGAIETGVSLAQRLSEWFDANKASVEGIGEAAGAVWDNLKGVLGTIASVLVGVVKWAAESGVITDALQGAALALAFLRDGFSLLRAEISEVGAAIVDSIDAPLRKAFDNTKGFLAQIPVIGQQLAHSMGAFLDSIPATSAQLRADAAAIRKDFDAGKTAVAATQAGFRSKQQISEDQAQLAREAARATSRSGRAGTSTPIRAVDPDAAKKAAAEAEKLRAAQRALADAEVDAAKKRAAAQRESDEVQLKGSLDRQLVTYTDYLGKKASFDKQAIDDELTAQRAKVAQLTSDQSSEKDAAKRTKLSADLVKASADIAVLEQKKVTIDARLKLDLEEFQRDVASLKVDITANILDAQGDTLQSGLLKLGQETQNLLRDKRVNGNADLEALVQQQSALRAARLQFDNASSSAGRVQSGLSNRESDINRQVTAGQLTQVEGERKIREARLAAADAMKESVTAARQLALATNDPALLQSASDLEQKYKDLAGSLDTVAVSINETFFGSIKQGFNDLISGAKSFGDVLTNIISSVLSKLADLALDQALGSLTTSLGGTAGGIGSFFSSLLGFAGGGSVDGPGTDTSDSILARLSRGEFVIKAASVRKLGVGFLNHVNDFGKLPRLPGFATGGVVGALEGLGSPSNVNNTINVGTSVTIAAGQVANALAKEPAFERHVVALISKHGRAIQGAWGN